MPAAATVVVVVVAAAMMLILRFTATLPVRLSLLIPACLLPLPLYLLLRPLSCVMLLLLPLRRHSRL